MIRQLFLFASIACALSSAHAEEVVPAEAPPAPPEASAPSSNTKSRGLLGPVLVGPTVSTLAVPTVLRYGLEAKLYDWVGLAIEHGTIPKLNVQGVSVEAMATTFSARVYPFKKAFFVGAGFGSQTLKAKKTERIQGQDITGWLDVTTSFITPEFGWRWIWASGFMMGMEFGYQLPSGANVNVKSDAPVYATYDPNYARLENDIKDAGDQIGNKPLPHFALLQLGYFF